MTNTPKTSVELGTVRALGIDAIAICRTLAGAMFYAGKARWIVESDIPSMGTRYVVVTPKVAAYMVDEGIGVIVG